MDNIESILLSIDDGLQFDDRNDLIPFVNWNNSNIPIHRWFRYREGFSPKLVDALSLKDPILDPFCGSGSIMIGAAIKGLVATGVDINPLATFAAKVKLTPLTRNEIQNVFSFSENLRALVESVDPWPVPVLSIAHKVFEPIIMDTLLRLRSALENTDNAHIRNFLLLGWLSILEDVGSYFKEGNGIKYRNKKRLKKGYTNRPDGVWQLERFGADQKAFVINAFAHQLAMMLSDTGSWEKGTWEKQQVLTGNSTRIDDVLGENAYQSIIFSPPYMNRFDYFESQKVELWFGNFVNSYQELSFLRKSSLRSHLGADLTRKSNTPINLVEELIDKMDRSASSWRMRVPEAVRGYFDDMYSVLKQCHKLQSRNGRCYVVVGNSAFAGVIIPTDSMIAHLGLLAGFSSATVHVVRHLTVAPQQRISLNGLKKYMRESIVSFRM